MFKKTQDIGAIVHNGGDTTESVIGPSVHLEGNFNSSGNIVVVGSLTGSLTTSGNVRVEEGAKVQATVSASYIHVAGEIRGDVQASDRLELAPTARVFGNVEVKVLSVAPGAILHGKCLMKNGAGKAMEDAPRKAKFGKVSKEEVLAEAEV